MSAYTGNYMHINFSYDCEILVQATPKNLEAFNALFGDATLYVEDRYTDQGNGFRLKANYAGDRIRVTILSARDVARRLAYWDAQEVKDKAKALAKENAELEAELNQPAVIDDGRGEF